MTTAEGSGTSDAEREANRANWDERVPVHLKAYDTDGFVDDPARISTVARDDLALMAPHLPPPRDAARPLAGLDLLHLQCHVGTDTLSFARLGASVTGLDFSPAAVAAARDLAGRAHLEATFVQADVAEAAAALDGATFDVVHTSIGVLTWLPDLRPWAAAIAAALRPRRAVLPARRPPGAVLHRLRGARGRRRRSERGPPLLPHRRPAALRRRRRLRRRARPPGGGHHLRVAPPDLRGRPGAAGCRARADVPGRAHHHPLARPAHHDRGRRRLRPARTGANACP